MSRGAVHHFQVISRRTRAKDLVSNIRRNSKRFKTHYAACDVDNMKRTSGQAWSAMTNLFESLRNEQDYEHLESSFMNAHTAFIVEDASKIERDSMITDRRINKFHSRYKSLSLRNTLNKIAHYDTDSATFRLDARGAHYLILGGKYRRSYWVAEILVSRLCTNAAAAVKAIT